MVTLLGQIGDTDMIMMTLTSLHDDTDIEDRGPSPDSQEREDQRSVIIDKSRQTMKLLLTDSKKNVGSLFLVSFILIFSSILFFCFLRLIGRQCVETMMGVRSLRESAKQTFSCVMLRFLQLAYFVVTKYDNQVV